MTKTAKRPGRGRPPIPDDQRRRNRRHVNMSDGDDDTITRALARASIDDFGPWARDVLVSEAKRLLARRGRAA